MKVWLACFVVLFALAELFDWLQEFALPLPIYILGGAFLAVASNYDKIIGSYLSDAIIVDASLEQPQLDSPIQSPSSISFKIASPVEDAQQKLESGE
ncbi:hypothetical protein VB735_27205 [Halotia wernerae UHCC 0503]|nr:hypothetical protein [Halotia wernerae UHCC 0503]